MAEATDSSRRHSESLGLVEKCEHFCGPCEKWEEKSSVAFCLECDDFLCVECTNAHERIPVLRKHHVLTGNDMPDEKQKKLLHKQCACNSGIHVTFYCPKDNKLLCRECRDKLHKKCSTVYIDDISAGILDTNMVPDALKTLENLKTAFQKIKSIKQHDWIGLQQTESGVLKELSELKENIIATFDRLQLSIAQELVLKVNPEDVSLGSEINTCSNIVNDIQGRITRINNAVCSQSDSVIFATVIAEIQGNTKYRDFLKKLNRGFESLSLKLEINKQVQNFLQLGSLGELKVSKSRNVIELPTVKMVRLSDYVKNM